MWEKPMSLYTVIINGFVFFLAALAILLIGYSGNYASVLLNFFLFVPKTPLNPTQTPSNNKATPSTDPSDPKP